ncbi:MAG: hypothetical protein IT423_12705, partial [Pirellulaceae bacterium]|nr:hypothetical protein [Pirellulaceae bacterium]
RTAAGYLAREFCQQWTGSIHSSDWQQTLGVLMVRGTLAPADKQELTRIVDIASRGCHERMTGPDFQKLGKTIAKLRDQTLVLATA